MFRKFSKFDITCKFSSIEERWKGWGWGGGETRTVQRKKLEQIESS